MKKNRSDAVIGAKSASLEKLTKAGYSVPSFFTINYGDGEILTEGIQSRLPNAGFFAVRSSAEAEDSTDASFAGHFYSAIGLRAEAVADEVKKVLSSYGEHRGGVIIQEFIPSDRAGVIFSDAGNGKIIINSNFGLCDTVVGGQKCDEYVLDREGKLVSRHIAEKSPHIFDGEKISKDAVISTESLNHSQLAELATIARSIQKSMGAPQDIEWCYKGEKLYILQSRPITRRIFDTNAVYFDSANIAESYSGIVLPLTCSFASYIYKTVYEDLLAHSGVSRGKIARYRDIFENMLGFFYGRMYYNMNSWYKMAAFIPGYKRNKKNLESMITSNVREDVEHDIEPSAVLKIKYPFIFASKLLFLPKTIANFRRNTEKKLGDANLLPLADFSFEQCRDVYFSLNERLLKNWYITVENDFMVMTYFGILKKAYGDEIIRDIIQFRSAASKQIGELASLAKNIQVVPALWKTLEDCDKKGFYRELNKQADIGEQLKSYYEKFGGRFANELKLESPDIEEDFKKFSDMVRLYSQSDIKDISQYAVVLPGNFLKKIFMGSVLKKFKKYSSQREELRLLRSNSFGFIRKLFNRIGILLVDKKVILEKDDIFYLKVDEIFGFSKLADMPSMLETVAKRKEEYASYRKVTPLSHFALSAGGKAPLVQEKYHSGGLIQGRPCTSGIVRGKVKLFRDFFIPDAIDFDIVVASHTDPGWTALIGISKGLIIEHGGVLSHASIVSRELGIPTVIGAEGALNTLKDGQLVELNGSNGTITIL